MNDRRSGERGSGISVLVARLDDDDDDIYNRRFLIEYFVDNILDKQNLICLNTIKWFQFIKYFGTTLYLSRRAERRSF